MLNMDLSVSRQELFVTERASICVGRLQRDLRSRARPLPGGLLSLEAELGADEERLELEVPAAGSEAVFHDPRFDLRPPAAVGQRAPKLDGSTEEVVLNHAELGG